MIDHPDHPDMEFEAALRQALSARPEPRLSPDLAARAIRRATAGRSSRAAFRRAALWRTVSSLAACLLIAGLLTLGAWRWVQSSSWTTGSETTDTTATSSVSSAADTTSSQNAALLLVAGAVLVLSLGLVTLDRMLSGDESAIAPVLAS